MLAQPLLRLDPRPPFADDAPHGRESLLAAAANPDSLATLVLACVISGIGRRETCAGRPRLGLPPADYAGLAARHFPAACEELQDEAACAPSRAAERMDEFDDLVSLLMEHRCDDSDETRWLAHAVAVACMGDNHLWQDMGLPHRAALSELMQTRFPGLAEKNTGDMKWKKFFYRQLCERADIFICKSPSCAVCVDYEKCFGPEDAPAQP